MRNGPHLPAGATYALMARQFIPNPLIERMIVAIPTTAKKGILCLATAPRWAEIMLFVNTLD